MESVQYIWKDSFEAWSILDFKVEFEKELDPIGLAETEIFGNHKVLQVVMICKNCEKILSSSQFQSLFF